MTEKQHTYIKDNNPEKKVCRHLEKKIFILKKYLFITKKVNRAINDNNKTDELTGLLSQRQACINKIDRIDLSINTMTKTGSDEINSSNRYYLKQIKNIIETIDSMDRELMVMAEQESEKIKAGLLKAHNTRQAAQGYAYGSKRGYKTGRNYSSKFLDIKK